MTYYVIIKNKVNKIKKYANMLSSASLVLSLVLFSIVFLCKFCLSLLLRFTLSF